MSVLEAEFNQQHATGVALVSHYDTGLLTCLVCCHTYPFLVTDIRSAQGLEGLVHRGPADCSSSTIYSYPNSGVVGHEHGQHITVL